MKTYSTKEFAPLVPCAVKTIAKWRTEKILPPAGYTDDRGYPFYTETQLTAARALIQSRKTKKNMPVDAATSPLENAIDNCVSIVPRDSGFVQLLENLPKEILSLPIFLEAREDNPKRPVISDWQNSKNQKLYSELKGIRGFVAATEQAGGLVMYDFDHCRNPDGSFVNDDAERWFNYLHAEEYFCEVSKSGEGLHMFGQPTASKFGKINQRLYFTEDKKSFLEVFYSSNRYCLCTGKPFHCKPNAPIAKGEVADEQLQNILNEIQRRTPVTLQEPKKASHEFCSTDTAFDSFRLERMLVVIPPEDLSFNEWFVTLSTCFNLGMSYTDFDGWCRRDTSTNSEGKPRYNPAENYEHWASRINPEFGFGQLYNIAIRYGYDAKKVTKEYYDMHPELSKHPAEQPARAGKGNDDAEKIIADIRNRCEWRYTKDGEGKLKRTTIKPTTANIKMIFEEDPNLRGLVGFNEFQGTFTFLKKAPWQKESHIGEQWRDSDDAELRMYLRTNYADIEHKQRIEDSVIHFANRNSFHPVQEYFRNLPKWDGTPRAENLFTRFLRADDTPFAREVTLNWLIAAVARIFRPGCNYSTALVLQGRQGIGKSYIAERLGGEWYGAVIDNVDDPHCLDALQNIWIGEFKEMSAMRKSDINAIKSFIERNSDNRRKAYERHATISRRHCVFIITVNDSEFLRDQTGNRRFIVLRCNSAKFGYVEGLTSEYIAQLWAEVYQLYKEKFAPLSDVELGKALELSHQTKQQAEAIAETYLQDDGMTTEVKAFLDKKLPPAIIWRLMNKNDRRKFFVDGQITFDPATLNYRRRTQGGREKDIERDINTIWQLLHSQRTDIQEIKKDTISLYRFYGSELREQICAAEIYNECFGTGDKRKLMYRINEILDTLDGWHLGDRKQNYDTEYKDQKKPYYRNEDNRPQEEADIPQAEKKSETTPYLADDFQGEPISPHEVPVFDEDNMPF